jgi:hypothetical protein
VDDTSLWDYATSFNTVQARLARIEQSLEGRQVDIARLPGDIDSRLARLERSIEELSGLIRGTIHAPAQGPPTASKPRQDTRTPCSTTSVESNEKPGNGVTRPVLLVRNLQTQFFGPKRDFSDEVLTLGSVVSAGIIRMSLARHLIQMSVDPLFPSKLR